MTAAIPTDEQENRPPVVTGAPERIWLVLDEDHESFADAKDEGSVLWCEDEGDVEYVRADTANRHYAALFADRQEWVDEARQLRSVLQELVEATADDRDATEEAPCNSDRLSRASARLEAAEESARLALAGKE